MTPPQTPEDRWWQEGYDAGVADATTRESVARRVLLTELSALAVAFRDDADGHEAVYKDLHDEASDFAAYLLRACATAVERLAAKHSTPEGGER